MTAVPDELRPGSVWVSRPIRMYARGHSRGQVVIDKVQHDGRVFFTYRSTGTTNDSTVAAFLMNYDFEASSVAELAERSVA